MSTLEIKEALESRDSALEGKFDAMQLENEKLERKYMEAADRIMQLEQRSSPDEFRDSQTPNRPSLLKTIKHLSNPRDFPLDGLEREWHQELSSKSAGIPGTSNAVFVPLSTRYVDYGTVNFNSPLESAGGSNLVPQELHPELIDLLRQQSVLMQQGIRVIQAQGDLDLPRKTTGTGGYWFGADGADSITESTPVFDTIEMRPKFVAGLTKVSYKMLTQAANIESILAADLAAVLAEQIDQKALQGTGSNSQPTGVMNQSGIGSLTWGGGDSPLSYSPLAFWINDAADMEQTLITAKAYQGNLSFLVDAGAYRTIRFQTDSNGGSVYGLDREGKLLGHNCTPTTHMPSNSALLGNWQDLVMATWGGIALATDGGGDNFAKGDLSIRAIMPVDFAVRHAASFVKSVKP